MQSKGIDDWGGRFFLEGEVESLVNSAEGSIFVRVELEGLDLAGPAPNQHQIMSVGNIVVLYLVGANRGQFISRHRPHIDAGIRFHSCCYYKFLALGDVDCALVAFEYISGEFFYLFKVYSSFPLELEIWYCFLEIQGCEIEMRADCNCSCAVVVEGSVVMLVAGGVRFPFFQVEKNQLVFGVAYEDFWVFDGKGGYCG